MSPYFTHERMGREKHYDMFAICLFHMNEYWEKSYDKLCDSTFPVIFPRRFLCTQYAVGFLK
jgi:hypothetical protein